ncbi:Putative DNA-binding domain-containing protein [Lentzea fradiae]|uniref:Putative DNA-binding domain-containing protein n=1 Tax=Lentzea fradiae TaxID=200378 RepID=A0A1G7R0R9_9PSEU|nr:DUF262 domain-containing protein [Lentzea fradiae]SDG04274.1 Putative DNA-binding domain-containing protein [Lentzea fradiae]
MKALFREVNYQLSKLLAEIEDGDIGLPEIQRPFVWSRTKVRDLFDSMYRGFPVGYFLFWENPAVPTGTRQIGTNDKQQVARRLIVDGQQRLTSLYSVIRNRPVVDNEYRQMHLAIAFRPRDQRFAVPDAAIQQDPEYISDVSQLWSGPKSRHRFQTEFIERLRANRGVSHDEEDRIIEAIDRLYDLRDYPFTALELSANATEEEVADIFVRINSEGVELKQADFILTLMSVHWDAGRRELEAFCRAAKFPSTDKRTPYNHFIEPSPDELLRVTVGLGLRRARLQAVYSVLRGKDAETGKLSEEARLRQFEVLREAQNFALDLDNWHDFLGALRLAGYRSRSMVTSRFTIVFSYVTFLVGRRDFGLSAHELRPVIARWFFMCTITGRYTGSSESRMEQDLRRFAEAKTGAEFIGVLDAVIATQLTNDFWEVALPDLLSTSAGYSPSLFAYHAALVLLDADVLFAPLKVAEVLDPASGYKGAADRYQLFRRKYLESEGIKTVSRQNQLANYAMLQWPGKKPTHESPVEYFPKLWETYVPAEQRDRTRFLHALPEGWEQLGYDEFLERRRKHIATVIKTAFDKLRTGTAAVPGTVNKPVWTGPSVKDLLLTEESAEVEFKQTGVGKHAQSGKSHYPSDAVTKSVAAFLNSSSGGTLGIGISDDKKIVGLDTDFQVSGMDIDKYVNAITSGLMSACGDSPITLHVRARAEQTDGKWVVLIDVHPSSKPVFTRTSKSEEVFFVRANNTTRQLSIAQAHDYITTRWPS